MPTGIGIALAVAGAGASIFAATQQNSANQDMIAAQQRAEQIRLAQMQADADRRRRQLIRQGMIARSQALATETAQGASGGENPSGSSAYGGAIGQVSGQTSFGVAGINISEKTGKGLFDANQQLFAAKSAYSRAQETSAFGSGLTSLGGTLLSNSGAIKSLSGSLFASAQPSDTGPDYTSSDYS